MTTSIAAALRIRLAALPFLERAYGLVRVAEELQAVPSSPDDKRLVRFPLPVDPAAATACNPEALLPSPLLASVAFFEEEGAVPGGTKQYPSLVTTLRLVAWVNTTRLSEPATEGEVQAAFTRALEGTLSVAGLTAVRVKVTQVLPGDGTALLSRYTLTDEARPLLRLPYVFIGLTVRVSAFRVKSPVCAPELPTFTPAPPCR